MAISSNLGINPTDSPGLPGGNSPSFLPPLPSTPSSSIPDNNASNSNQGIILDQLSNLLEVSFDNNSFPAVSFKETGTQDLSLHKYPNLDIARLENTGRNSSVWNVKGVFTNHIYPSNNETWVSGNLFPNTFNLIRNSLLDTTRPIKTLIHPYDGPKNVMVQSWDFEFIGTGPRDGVYLDMTFVETLGGNVLSNTTSPPNPTATLSNIASALDTQFAGANSPIAPPGMSLNQFFSQLAATVRNIMAIPSAVVGSLTAPIFQLSVGINQVISSAQFYQNSSTQYVGNNQSSFLLANVNTGQPAINYSYQALQNVYSAAFSLNSAQHNNANQFINSTIAFLQNMINYYTSMSNINTADIKLNLYLMMYQLQQIQATLFKNSNQWSIQQYVTQNPTTLISLSNILNNSIDQLLSLNPTINKTLYISSNTQVSYFQS